MKKIYKMSWPNWLVRDQRSVQFHVEANDYFATLAAILNLLEQKPELIGHPALLEVKKDLLILQEDYKIVSSNDKDKIKNPKNRPKGKLINQ